ncbi:MAG: cytochrome c [Anaerolineae bacterium]|nr:cytochrome c [Anaerolineae bacterium]
MSNFVIVLILVLLLAGCAPAPPMSATPTGNAERGAQIFTQGQDDTPPCLTCHQVVNGQVGFGVGPNLDGIAERAGVRVAGMTAAEYLRQSILEPQLYVVSGYRNIMYPDYRTLLTEQDIQDLIAYLLTL